MLGIVRAFICKFDLDYSYFENTYLKKKVMNAEKFNVKIEKLNA